MDIHTNRNNKLNTSIFWRKSESKAVSIAANLNIVVLVISIIVLAFIYFLVTTLFSYYLVNHILWQVNF